MPVDIFRDSTKALPKSDRQIIRVNMDELEIGGRKSNLPSQDPKNPDLSITHVPNAG
jgi:hypothetical protein